VSRSLRKLRIESELRIKSEPCIKSESRRTVFESEPRHTVCGGRGDM